MTPVKQTKMGAPKGNRNSVGNKGGRPTKYQGKITLKKCEEYIVSCVDEVEQVMKYESVKSTGYENKLKVKLPKREGLSLCLGVSMNTMTEWGEKHVEFLRVLERIDKLQAERLIDEALAGNYNAVIAKLLLSKHGYHEKSEQDITTQGRPIAGVVLMPRKLTPEEAGLNKIPNE